MSERNETVFQLKQTQRDVMETNQELIYLVWFSEAGLWCARSRSVCKLLFVHYRVRYLIRNTAALTIER